MLTPHVLRPSSVFDGVVYVLTDAHAASFLVMMAQVLWPSEGLYVVREFGVYEMSKTEHDDNRTGRVHTIKLPSCP